MAIDETQIRAALARVLASPGFVAAPNLAAFLRYVVEETLAGRGDRLKAYTIAVTALDRAENFDPNDNPLVRVQARRLRSALARYYETDGAEDPLGIDLPVGSYVPRFAPRATTGAPPTEPPTSTPARRRRRSLVSTRAVFALLLVTLVVLSGIGGLGLVHWREHLEIDGRSGLVERDFEPGVGLDAARVLPILVVEVEAETPPIEGFDAESYRRRIEAFAERFDDMVVVSRRSADFPAPPGQPLYRLHFGFVSERGGANAYFQLIHAGDERVVRAGAFRLAAGMKAPHHAGSTFDTPSDLAIVREIVEANGTVVLDAARLRDIGDPLACLILGNLFASDHNETLHRAARTCLESAIAANPRLAPAYTLLGEMYLREYRRNFDRLPGDPLARAEATLHRAISLAPISATPRQTLSEVLQLRGDLEGALVSGAGAVDLNPEDMTNVARYGTLLARLGRSEEALPLLRRAEANIATPPTWIADHVFLALDLLGRTDEADRAVGDARLSHAALHLAAAAITTHRRGDAPAAAFALAALIEIAPAFRDDPLTPWRRRGFAQAVAAHLVGALRTAGLPAPRA